MIACTSFVSTARSTPLTISVPSSSATCRFFSSSSAKWISFKVGGRSAPSAAATVDLIVARFRRRAARQADLTRDPATPCATPKDCWYDRAHAKHRTSSTDSPDLSARSSPCFSSARSGCRRSAARSESGMREFKDSVTGVQEQRRSRPRSELPPPRPAAACTGAGPAPVRGCRPGRGSCRLHRLRRPRPSARHETAPVS